MLNHYKLIQTWDDGIEILQCGPACIVCAEHAGEAKQIASEDSEDGYWLNAEVEQIGWATGEPVKGLIGYEA